MRTFFDSTASRMGAIALFLGCTALALSSCHKESKSVCDHLRELTADSEHYQSTHKSYARCVKEVTAYFEEDPENFRRLKECVLDAQTIEEADRCAQ